MLENNEYPPVEIPLGAISPDALNGIMDSFINREGTDYGLVEVLYEKKIERIKRQLECGEIKIVFDLNSDSVTLLTANDWKKLTSVHQ